MRTSDKRASHRDAQAPFNILILVFRRHCEGSGALNKELSEISYNELEIYQDWESLLVIAYLPSLVM